MRIAQIKEEDSGCALDCGESDINRLIQSAYIATLQKQGIAFNAFEDDELVAQFMLTMHMIGDPDRNSFPVEKRFASVKIEYIAVSRMHQHRGIGTFLMKYAVKYIRDICAGLPVRFILLDSVQDKAEWYSQFGFCKADPEWKLGYQDDYTVPMCIDFVNKQDVEEYEERYVGK